MVAKSEEKRRPPPVPRWDGAARAEGGIACDLESVTLTVRERARSWIDRQLGLQAAGAHDRNEM